MSGRMLPFIYFIVAVIGYFIASFALVPDGLASATWPFFLAIAAPSVVSWIAGFFASLAKRIFDRRWLAGLPMDGEDWATQQLRELGLHDHTVSTGGHRDAYDRDDRVVMLSQTSATESTVRAWATVAHELGHAVVRCRWSVLDFVLTMCRAYWQRFFYAGLALCAGGVMLGFEPAVGAAHIAWIISFALACGQLIDEFAASLVALRLLGRSRCLSPVQMISSALYLVIMFGTYVTMNAVLMAFLTASDWIADMIGPILIEGSAAPVAGWRIAVILVLALLVFVVLIDLIVDLLRRRVPSFGLMSWIGLLLPFILLLTWDQPAVLEHPWLILLAFIPTFEILAAPVSVAALIGAWFVSRLCRVLVPSSPWRHAPSYSIRHQFIPSPGITKAPIRRRIASHRIISGLAELIHVALFLPLLWFLLW